MNIPKINEQLLEENFEVNNDESDVNEQRTWSDDGSVGIVQDGKNWIAYNLSQGMSKNDWVCEAKKLAEALGLGREYVKYWVSGSF